jgi:predicted 3-demethylubiquinone-9 3-methyltransferase (glyoxalase superfamily)
MPAMNLRREISLVGIQSVYSPADLRPLRPCFCDTAMSFSPYDGLQVRYPLRAARSRRTKGPIPMQHQIIPNLWFDTEAEEAADFYTSVFENSRIVNVARYTEAGPRPAGTVMTVEFELDGQRFVGINGGPQFTFDEAVSFQITCETQGEVDRYWERLSEGGSEGQCGWLKDRFGLSWQVVPTGMEELFADPDPKRAERAMQAMLQMSKLDIAALRSAADGVPAS